MRITSPKFMALKDWADQVTLDLDQYGAFGKLMDETEWQDWAVNFLNTPSLSGNFPDPYEYDDWREWAMGFYYALGV